MKGLIKRKIKAGVGVAKDNLDAALLALDNPKVDQLMDSLENLTETRLGPNSDLARVLATNVLKRVRLVKESLVRAAQSSKRAEKASAKSKAKSKAKVKPRAAKPQTKPKKKIKVRAATKRAPLKTAKRRSR